MNLTEVLRDLDRDLERAGINSNGTIESIVECIQDCITGRYHMQTRMSELDDCLSQSYETIRKKEKEWQEATAEVKRLDEENDKLSDRVEELLAELEALRRPAA